jgi:hypothetical protein
MLNTKKALISFLINGSREWPQKSIEDILLMPAEKVSVQDLEKLTTKRELLQVFHAATAPDFESVKGEYQAKMIVPGIGGLGADFFMHNLFGPGHWEGKAFNPSGKDKGRGYNIFTSKRKSDGFSVIRSRPIETLIAMSKFDEKESFFLKYSSSNPYPINSMFDEVRKVNDTLFICLGFLPIVGGVLNPSPFVLYGEPTDWVGFEG